MNNVLDAMQVTLGVLLAISSICVPAAIIWAIWNKLANNARIRALLAEHPTTGTIFWPPKPPSLHSGYLENHYRVREAGAHPWYQSGDPVAPVMASREILDGGTKLVFTGDAHWVGEACFMRMHVVGNLGHYFWMRSIDIVPEDEAPKEARP